jgi:hypothetical protein
MRPFSRTRRAIVAGTLALAAGTFAAAPAEAAAPTRIRDHTTSVSCQALNGSTLTRFLVAASDLAGTEARAQISEDGVTLAEGQGTSDWTDTTFRASVQLEDATGGGHLGTAGEAFLSGTYRATGEPVRELNRFKDGNIRVVEDHTTSTLTVSDVVLTVNGERVADVECVGEQVDGFLFFTAPASYVLRGGFLVSDDCDTQNMEGLGLFGTMDALFLSFEYADTADSSASSGEMDLTAGPFSGEISYNDGVGPAGTVSATVSAVRNGRVIRNFVERSDVFSERWVMTPYLLTIAAEGREGADASATCQVFDIDATQHLKTGKLDG